jgi:hypothetical protein
MDFDAIILFLIGVFYVRHISKKKKAYTKWDSRSDIQGGSNMTETICV